MAYSVFQVKDQNDMFINKVFEIPPGVSIDVMKRRLRAFSCHPPYHTKQEADAALQTEQDPEGGTL